MVAYETVNLSVAGSIPPIHPPKLRIEMEFTEDQLRLIRAACVVAMPHIDDPENYFEPWKSTYAVATAQLKKLGVEDSA
jgi:hypothetical protein